jgi:hypothetical protein
MDTDERQKKNQYDDHNVITKYVMARNVGRAVAEITVMLIRTLILKLSLYLICIKFHYCTLLTLLIQISHNLHTYILYAAVFFVLL